MAPVCEACRLLSVLFVFIYIFPTFIHHCSSLLVYDRFQLLDIRYSTEQLSENGLGRFDYHSTKCLANIPAFLCRFLCSTEETPKSPETWEARRSCSKAEISANAPAGSRWTSVASDGTWLACLVAFTRANVPDDSSYVVSFCFVVFT